MPPSSSFVGLVYLIYWMVWSHTRRTRNMVCYLFLIMRISYFYRICLDFNQRILRRMLRYSSVWMQWQHEKDAHHRNLHWLGFTTKEAMFAPYLAQQKLRTLTKMSRHCLWSLHQMRWLNSSRTLRQVKSWVTGMLKWPTLGRTLRPCHYLHGKLSSQSGIFNRVLRPLPYLQVVQRMPRSTLRVLMFGTNCVLHASFCISMLKG